MSQKKIKNIDDLSYKINSSLLITKIHRGQFLKFFFHTGDNAPPRERARVELRVD